MSPYRKVSFAWIGVFLLVFSFEALAQRNSSAAQSAWDGLIVAKGGRLKLHAVENYLMTTFADEKSSDPSIVSLFVLSGRVWDASYEIDGKRIAQRCDSVLDQQELVLASGQRIREPGGCGDSISYYPAVYLLETRYGSPTPISVTRQRSKKGVTDVLQTSFHGRRIDYYYEPEEMLVREVITYFEDSRVDQHFILDKYVKVDGVQMPTQVGMDLFRRPKRAARVEFQLNVDFAPELFTEPLVLTGFDGWKRKSPM
jgi:hypothetical protein